MQSGLAFELTQNSSSPFPEGIISAYMLIAFRGTVTFNCARPKFGVNQARYGQLTEKVGGTDIRSPELFARVDIGRITSA